MPSRFDRDTIREYFEYCQRAGKKRVTSINALTDHAHKTASNDEEIREWLFPAQQAQTMTCPTCKGSGQVQRRAASDEPCYMCKGTRLQRFNPASDEDEDWPCPVCQSAEFDEQVQSRGGIREPAIRFSGRGGLVSLKDARLLQGNNDPEAA
jgi:DnaJ-class molecular chaperone